MLKFEFWISSSKWTQHTRAFSCNIARHYLRADRKVAVRSIQKCMLIDRARVVNTLGCTEVSGWIIKRWLWLCQDFLSSYLWWRSDVFQEDGLVSGLSRIPIHWHKYYKENLSLLNSDFIVGRICNYFIFDRWITWAVIHLNLKRIG